MKEAAYKLYVQSHPSRFYNPKKFVCALKGNINRITYLDFECFVKTEITSKYILSEARLINTGMTSKQFNFKMKHYQFQSEAIHYHLLSSISKAYKLSKSSLKLIKCEFGIPRIYFNSKLLNLKVSITHHGGYGAFAIS
jgi:phosphopantetheinyl transferase